MLPYSIVSPLQHAPQKLFVVAGTNILFFDRYDVLRFNSYKEDISVITTVTACKWSLSEILAGCLAILGLASHSDETF